MGGVIGKAMITAIGVGVAGALHAMWAGITSFKH